MTLKELMSGSIQAGGRTSAFPVQNRPVQSNYGKSDSMSFHDIFGSKVSSPEMRNADRMNRSGGYAAQRRSEGERTETESRPAYLTFREASEGRKQVDGSDSAIRKTSTDKTGEPKEKIEEDVEKDRLPISDKVIHVLALLLGVGAEELQKLMKEAGLPPEALAQDSIGRISRDLTELLGLTEEQQGTLERMLQWMSESLDTQGTSRQKPVESTELTASDSVKQSGTEEITGQVRAETMQSVLNGEAKTDTAKDADAFIDSLSRKIKSKLEEYGILLENDQSSAEEEWKAQIRPLAEKAGIRASSVQMQETSHMNGEEAKQVQPDEAANKEQQVQADDPAEESGQQLKTASGSEENVPAITTAEASTQAVFSVTQPDKANAVQALDKPTAPVQAREIVSQIIEKAKVVLSPEKSEMVMDLKPESLGRISLKVVTESGIVMAKFIAENQQVRQVLESNMQLLKDSLERQGMNVQGFSVSVRQDGNGSGTDRQQFGNNSRSNGGSVTGITRRFAGLQADFSEAVDRPGPYRWENSTINFTA